MNIYLLVESQRCSKNIKKRVDKELEENLWQKESVR